MSSRIKTLLRQPWFVASCLLVASFAWAYWPTLHALYTTWKTEPDYSHGFLVLPFCLILLWTRREQFPLGQVEPAWGGLLLLMLSIGMRISSSLFFLDALDGWSIIPWVAGSVWLIGGPHLVRWSLPGILFLFFLVPLPFRIEHSLSVPLQQIATKLSCFGLQCLGQPAMAEGNTILLGEYQLEVAQACSGLRIFVGTVALACAYVAISRVSWWERAILLMSSVPIAVAANSIRIVGTGLMYRYCPAELAQAFSHDLAGWVMIPLAASMFAFLLWYLSHLVYDARLMDMKEVIRHDGA